MKNVLSTILILFLFLSCQSPNTDRIPVEFQIQTFDVANSRMEVVFSITNPTQTVWEGGAWSLHWNSIYGVVDSESLPQGIQFTYVDGQYYQYLEFGADFSLPPDETLTLPVSIKGIVNRLVMGPGGFFVHNHKTQKNIDLKSTIVWEQALGLEGLKIPSAEDRFLRYEGMERLPKEALQWVIPTPQKQDFMGAFRVPTDLNIDWSAFAMEEEFMQQRLQEALTIKITANPQVPFNLIVSKNDELAAEGYHLNILEDQIHIEAAQEIGVFYAFESLHQILWMAQNEAGKWPLLHIEDQPRFQNRGFMTDIARNFYPKEKIFQILDYMALYKLNRFDLKLTDDDGWRIEIPGLPELTEVGGHRGYTTDERDRLIPMYSSGSGDQKNQGSGFLSTQDFADILRYAKKRYIEVIPQISFPSHARAAIVAMKARYENYKEQGDYNAAVEYLLHDPEDSSKYLSAQLYSDNVVCICDPSAYRFYEKVIQEIFQIYQTAEVPMKVFNIGADELPYGPWQKAPKCEAYIKENPAIEGYSDLYNFNLRLLNKMISEVGAKMVGWEDALLVHSENEQSEIGINPALTDLDFTPYVWNNSWGGGREDMIYRLCNQGFPAIMSNSSAFYFDMVDDRDMENVGMSWSGYVSYRDSWGTEPLNVFANKVTLEAQGIRAEEVATKEMLQPDSVKNFLGIQSQLWTETATNESQFDEMLMPNLIIFAERAWAKKEAWLELPTAAAQKPLLLQSWNRFTNTLGQRQLPFIQHVYGGLAFELPKPGGQIEKGMLNVRQQFPGQTLRYSLDGSKPTPSSPEFDQPIPVDPANSKIGLRSFDVRGRGGKTIFID